MGSARRRTRRTDRGSARPRPGGAHHPQSFFDRCLRLPTIRALLEKDLKAHGITTASGESANTIRITLSQNDRERLWVAE